MPNRPIIDAAIERVRENRPIVAGVVESVVSVIQRTAERDNNPLHPEAAAQVAASAPAIAAEIMNDPVAQNQLNLEPLPQSRTFISSLGSLGTILGALATILIGISTGNFDIAFGDALGVIIPLVVGGAVSGWGAISRVRTDQKPFGWFGLVNLVRKMRGRPAE